VNESENQIAQHLLYNIDQFRKLGRNLRKLMEFEGQSMHLLLFIERLTEHGPVSISKLKEELGVSFPATTQFVNHLEKMNYLEKIRHPQDRRMVLIQCSPLGKEFCYKAYHQMQSLTVDMVRYIGIEDSLKLNEILMKITAFCAIKQEYKE